MNKSDSINELAAALVLAQPMVETAKLNSKNPAFSGSRYADLGSVWEAVQGALIANRLSITQFPDETTAGHPALTTMLVHASGQWISATYPLVCVKQDPQGYGSALTYAKRYGIAAVMGVVADDDDDGNLASSKPKPPVATKTPPPQPDPRPDHDARKASYEAQKPPSQAPAKITPAQWAMQEISAIRAATSPAALKAWETTNAVALHRLKLADPDAHRDLIDNLDARAKALLAA